MSADRGSQRRTPLRGLCDPLDAGIGPLARPSNPAGPLRLLAVSRTSIGIARTRPRHTHMTSLRRRRGPRTSELAGRLEPQGDTVLVEPDLEVRLTVVEPRHAWEVCVCPRTAARNAGHRCEGCAIRWTRESGRSRAPQTPLVPCAFSRCGERRSALLERGRGTRRFWKPAEAIHPTRVRSARSERYGSVTTV